MNADLIWIIAGLGAIALVGVCYRMTKGFGPFNLRAIGIVLVATFASLLALGDSGSLTAAIGILGAIAGAKRQPAIAYGGAEQFAKFLLGKLPQKGERIKGTLSK